LCFNRLTDVELSIPSRLAFLVFPHALLFFFFTSFLKPLMKGLCFSTCLSFVAHFLVPLSSRARRGERTNQEYFIPRFFLLHLILAGSFSLPDLCHRLLESPTRSPSRLFPLGSRSCPSRPGRCEMALASLIEVEYKPGVHAQSMILPSSIWFRRTPSTFLIISCYFASHPLNAIPSSWTSPVYRFFEWFGSSFCMY